jgi:flagellar basal-body rod protein FlgF
MFVQNRLGLIESLETMRLQTEKLNQISNNLANADTTGYKKNHVTFDEVLLRTAGGRQRVAKGLKIATDFGQGSLEQTGDSLQVAINGDGFFRIRTPNGVRYTRDGSFRLNGQGQLVTQMGDQVLGQGGTIQLDSESVQIGQRGEILSKGQLVDQLAIVSFADPDALEKEGESLYRLKSAGTTREEPAQNFSVRQGYLESSDVDAMSEMIGMIEVTRTTESQQKMIQAIDDLDGMAVRQVGTLPT